MWGGWDLIGNESYATFHNPRTKSNNGRMKDKRENNYGNSGLAQTNLKKNVLHFRGTTSNVYKIQN